MRLGDYLAWVRTQTMPGYAQPGDPSRGPDDTVRVPSDASGDPTSSSFNPDMSIGGRAALGAALAGPSTTTPNAVLGLMGLLSGPIGGIAMSGLNSNVLAGGILGKAAQALGLDPALYGGLKGAMQSDNAAKLTAAYSALTPSQRAAIDSVTAHNITTTTNIAYPQGQKQTPAFQAQRQGERSLETIDVPITQELIPEVPPAVTFSQNSLSPGQASMHGAPGTLGMDAFGRVAEGNLNFSGPRGQGRADEGIGVPSSDPAPDGTGGLGQPSGITGTGEAVGEAGPWDTGGLIPDRQKLPNLHEKITAQEGEYVVRRSAVKKYRPLLEAINKGSDSQVKRALKAALTA